ncbi:hypothetical protein [Rhodococcus tukisamuensis]|uniref:Uncharacterized protein n=1 Tax=Rhodococcus tukisamuensis TaxID=168276 RepID=A0A1G6X9Y3_9NOCA|nr:hypothetical protein [Rhodococcus tukisamuensis]SDD74901.1 hypothetical protein SAMN05444580_106137 [Rhodococcus tukisamuensis]
MGISAKRAIAGGVAAVAIGIGVAAPAGATTDPPAPVTTFAAGAGVGDIAAPQGMTSQALIAAWNAGVPIYEEVGTKDYPGTKSSNPRTEYRRVFDINALSSPTTKFVGAGPVAPDTFWVDPGVLTSWIRVNMRESWHANVGSPIWESDLTELKFTRSPLVKLPDGGPGVGIALVTYATGSS